MIVVFLVNDVVEVKFVMFEYDMMLLMLIGVGVGFEGLDVEMINNDFEFVFIGNEELGVDVEVVWEMIGDWMMWGGIIGCNMVNGIIGILIDFDLIENE